MLCVRNRKGVDGWGVVGGKEWRGKRRSPGRAPLFAGRRSGRYSTRSRGAHNVSLCAPLQGTGLGRAEPQKGPKGAGPVARVLEQYQFMLPQLRGQGQGRRIHRKDPKGERLQPLFRGTVPAKIYDGRKPSDSTAPASRDPSAFLWPVARSQGRPRLPAGLPGGWGRVGGGFGVRRVLGHSGGNTGHYDGSSIFIGRHMPTAPPKGTSAPPADSSLMRLSRA
jgi:hypothetical protein